MFKMLKRKLRHCRVNYLSLLLLLALTLVTLTVVKNHDKIALPSSRNLELAEYNNPGVNCTKIINGDAAELEKAVLRRISVEYKKKYQRLTAQDILNMTKDCSSFTRERKYILYPLSEEENEFPIAYSIVVHHNIHMLERLLRSIYMPQNYYCIHIDKKSSESFLSAVKAITSCFDNVFIASEMENVVYASWSRLQADLNCMKDLYQANAQWKYLINLCGMDFPIKTNREMVQTLKALKGENSLETEKMPSHKEIRWRKHYEISGTGIMKTDTDKAPPPIQIPVFSGSAYFVVSRAFVRHVLKDDQVKVFLDWNKDTYSPDEHLWATLQRVPGMPGAVPANSKYDVSDMNAIARFVKWHYLEGDVAKGAPYPPCTGSHVRSVCVFGVGDLEFMLKKHHLFANKFDDSIDPIAIQCLEEHLRHKALHPDRSV